MINKISDFVGGREMQDERKLFAKHAQNFKLEKDVRNQNFFRRFPKVDFHGKRVLDLACGLGSLTIDLIDQGASSAIGLDIDPEPINYANYVLETEYSEYKEKVSFTATDLVNIAESFDIIVCKAALEHFLSLKEQMQMISDKLNPNGLFVAAIGPLYYSPWGDHNRLKHCLPWSHLIFSEHYFFKKLNKKSGRRITSLNDLGLNGLKLKEYRSIFNNTTGLEVIDFRTNVSEKLLMKLFNLFSHIPFLEEFFTYNIHCVLKKETVQRNLL